MSDRNPVPAYLHSHSKYSNESVPKYEGIQASSHLFEPYLFAEANYGTDSVSAVTDHFETEGIDNWRRTADSFEENGWRVETGQKVLKAEKEDTTHYGINGVEAALEVEDGQSHTEEFLVLGLDLDDEREHLYQDFDGLLETAEQDAEIAVLPHPFMMEFGWENEEFDEFFSRAEDYDVDVGVELPMGYGFLNSLADGRVGSEMNVADVCDKYEVPAVPGTDTHSYVPRKKTFMDASAKQKLEEDEVPTKEISDMSVNVSPGKLPEFLDTAVDTAGAGTAFSGRIPLFGPGFRKAEGFHRAVRDLSLKLNEGFDPDRTAEEAVRLNGEEGYLDRNF